MSPHQSKLGDAHKLSHDDDRTCRHINLRYKVDSRAVSNVDRSNVYDLCVVAHGVSSLAQANADKGIGSGSIIHDFAEVLGANIVSDYGCVFVDVDFGASFELDSQSGVFGNIKDAFHSDGAE